MWVTVSVGGRAAVLQHGLDQLDPAARAVALVAQQDIGRAGRRAEAAVHALADLRVAGGGLRIGELGRGEGGLHQPPPIRPGLSTPFGSKAAFTRAVSAASAPVQRLERRRPRRDRAWRGRPAPGPRADLRGSASVSSQTRPPPQS